MSLSRAKLRPTIKYNGIPQTLKVPKPEEDRDYYHKFLNPLFVLQQFRRLFDM